MFVTDIYAFVVMSTWLPWKIVARVYTSISPILNRILTKLGRLVLKTRISQGSVLLHGKLVTMATIMKLGYHSNCK